MCSTGSFLFAQNASNDFPVLYPVGYQNIIVRDSGRTYKPSALRADKFYYRPVEIDFWYPAMITKSSDTPLHFGDFLNLLEERSNRFQDDTIYKSMSTDLVQWLGINLQIGDTSTLTRLPTLSYPNAVSISRLSPLIVYMSSYNGMSYENIRLFEFLAEHGYTIACITSVGRYPGNMSTKLADLLEQVEDGAFAIRLLKKRNQIDSTKIGVMGYSWGGLAAMALATEDPEIKCILSLDGSEIHYYGESRDDDKDFDAFRSPSLLWSENILVPYAYLESGFKQTDRDVDSIFNMVPQLRREHLYAHFPKATHEDFSCLPYLFNFNNDSLGFYHLLCQFSLHYFDFWMKDKSPGYARQVSFLFQHQMADSTYPIVNPSLKTKYIVKGTVVDAESKQALPYVNAGIPNKNTGTVTSRDGGFQINIRDGSASDSLKFSMAGYSGQSFCIRDIVKLPAPFLVSLQKNIAELNEVLVTRKLLPVKTLGNTTTSRFINVGLPLKFLGSEIGIRFSLGKNPELLKNFNFNISDIRLDTAVFRLNIYRFKNGIPGENILQKNILIPVGRQTGRVTVHLSEDKLILNGDILVSIEWIEGSSSGKENGALFLSASFLSSATWHRLTSQGSWKKASGLGVGFNLEVQKIP